MSKARDSFAACILAGAAGGVSNSVPGGLDNGRRAPETWRCPNGEEIATAYQDDGGGAFFARAATLIACRA